MDAHAHDIKTEVKGYILVFVALAILTVVTVAVKFLHLQLREAIIVALIIASIKGTLVACYFMHLISERKFIYSILTLTILLFITLVILLLFGHHDVLEGIKYVS